MAKRITLKEVARLAGVSETAASFALNGRVGVSDATRARVLEVAKSLDWQPNHAARALSGAGTSTIGLVIARSTREFGSESFFVNLMAGIQEVLSSRRFSILLQIVGSIEEEISTYRTWSVAARVDGVVVVDLRIDDPRPALLAGLSMPAVLVGVADPGHLRPAITIDDKAAMNNIISHLIDTGHKHIMYFCGDASAQHIAARRVALLEASQKYDIRTEVRESGYPDANFGEVVSTACSGEDKPDALIFDNEILALSGFQALTKEGLTVPADMCIVVWEDSPVARAMTPALTALDRDPFNLGVHAASRLFEVIGGDTRDEAEPIPSLIMRASSNCERV